MKKSLTVFILLLFTVLCIVTDNIDKNAYKILGIKSADFLYLDINKNNQIDDDELVKIYGIEAFYPSFEKYGLSVEEIVYQNYKFKIWAKRNLINRRVKIISADNNEYVLKYKKDNLASIIVRKGFSFPIANEYKDLFDVEAIIKIINAENLSEFAILNKRNNKFHNLDCKFGIMSDDYKIIPKSQLPVNAESCKYCIPSKERFNQKYLDKNPHLLNSNNISCYKKFGNIEIYFIDFYNTKKPDGSCSNIACKRLVSEINSAKSEIVFAIYGINNQPKVIEALNNARKKGVKTKWVTDFDSRNENYYKDTKILRDILSDYRNDVASTKQAIMHNKFFVFDNQKVWTGSSNITDTDFSSFNANFNILIDSADIASLYKKEFNQMYNGKFHTDKDIKGLNSSNNLEIYFSPQDKIISNRIIPLINSAQKYIYIPVFYLTHKGIQRVLIDAKKRNVDVKIIIDATNAHGKYSIHHALRQAGIQVKTENKAGKMHMKAMIIDDKYSLIGSMNFTKSGELYNDENVVIIKDKAAAVYLKEVFLNLWNSIPDKYLYKDPRAESFDSTGSCYDGIDNNFDGKIDSLDAGCIK